MNSVIFLFTLSKQYLVHSTASTYYAVQIFSVASYLNISCVLRPHRGCNVRLPIHLIMKVLFLKQTTFVVCLSVRSCFFVSLFVGLF